MRNTMARTSVAGVLTLVWLLAGCTPSQPNASRRYETAPRPSDSQILQPPHEFYQSRSASVVFVEYVVTPHDVVSRMLQLAGVRRDDVVYDLGCGDGRILIAAAKKYHCQAVGFDLDPLRVEEARASARKHHVSDRVTVELKDILTVDLRPATVVTLYLGTELNRKLIPQLKQLAPGTRIVSHNFAIGDIPPDRVVRMTSREDQEDHLIYLWTCPLEPSAAREKQ